MKKNRTKKIEIKLENQSGEYKYKYANCEAYQLM